jgi:cytochrome c
VSGVVRVGILAVVVSGCAAGAAAVAIAAANGPPAAGNAAAGEKIYGRCAACHALAWDRTGPHHCGLFGRRAGTVPNFNYSEAMKRSGVVWNVETLDRFLANPMATVPGTSMGYAGVTDAHERADLIAYLRQAGTSPACHP